MKKSIIAVLAFFLPAVASAHEVYVLTPAEIKAGVVTPPFSEWQVAFADMHHFLAWAFLAVLVISTVFCISIMRPLERACAPFFARIRRYAAPIARITVGASFIAAAYFGATYGPELPIAATFGVFAPLVQVALAALGLALVVGLYVRFAAFAALALFIVAVCVHGTYMLTYMNYLGEILVLLILGVHHGDGPDKKRQPAIAQRFAPYSFALLRVMFGISLFYASYYAKILHNDLALQVASLPLAGHAHSIAYYLGFEPHFLVMGAAIIEIVIALFFMLGIEIRWTSLFLLFWLALSLSYFGEVVWPHLILIGIPVAFMCWGYDRYSIEGYFLKRGAREPVL